LMLAGLLCSQRTPLRARLMPAVRLSPDIRSLTKAFIYVRYRTDRAWFCAHYYRRERWKLSMTLRSIIHIH
jgi:hypothetical protein